MNKGRIAVDYFPVSKANLEINRNSSEILDLYSELFSKAIFMDLGYNHFA